MLGIQKEVVHAFMPLVKRCEVHKSVRGYVVTDLRKDKRYFIQLFLVQCHGQIQFTEIAANILFHSTKKLEIKY